MQYILELIDMIPNIVPLPRDKVTKYTSRKKVLLLIGQLCCQEPSLHTSVLISMYRDLQLIQGNKYKALNLI